MRSWSRVGLFPLFNEAPAFTQALRSATPGMRTERASDLAGCVELVGRVSGCLTEADPGEHPRRGA